ncbi:MAG: hypothetical protein NZU63_14250 [Gemmataceae bacterium]|nr:hypothetical protein [Gemmataceae bacterium]
MNNAEALQILGEELARFVARSYAELARLAELDHVETYEVRGPSGIIYQIEIQTFWDDPREKRVIRVLGCIDDGGIRACFPLGQDVLVEPSNHQK